MEIYPHPAGQIVALNPREQFQLRDSEGSIRVQTVTAFSPGDELGPYWTAFGKDMETHFERELEFRFRDAGLLPPHVRRVLPGQPELDFPANLADTGLHAAQGMQVGAIPFDRDVLPRSNPAVSRFGAQSYAGARVKGPGFQGPGRGFRS